MASKIQPFIGDLKVVKQKLVNYAAGEFAHIENILKSEKRSRKHRKLRQTEDIVFTSTDTTEENLQDLQSTERFELQKESQKTISSDTSFKAGVDVTGGFGPVEVSAYAKFATSNSSVESNRNAVNYAKDITERSLSRIIERVRQERTSRSLQETEEINKHGFDNTGAGASHISGFYRWVDKYYRAKVVNYGKRLMYELTIPEPGAFFIHSQHYKLENFILPEEPEKPMFYYNDGTGRVKDFHPKDLTRTNYLGWVRKYNAQGISPPPSRLQMIEKSIVRENLQHNTAYAFSNESLKIPNGYKCMSAKINWNIKRRWDDHYLDISIGDKSFGNYQESQIFFEYTGGGYYDNTSVIPITVTSYNYQNIGCNIQILCILTDEAFEKWQIETFDAIMNAYNKQVLDYEEKLAAAQIQNGVQISGRNPVINREIEREELKKGFISSFIYGTRSSVYRFDDPDKIWIASNDYPEISLLRTLTQSDKIQFFEQAFDWKNMTYQFLPYYWGRKENWLDTLAIEDNDPLFEKFLKAGAARVLVPVNPAYNFAILYYQITGRFDWDSSVPFSFDSYFDRSLVEEVRTIEVDDIDKEVEIKKDDEETWLMKVPTSLVWLDTTTNALPVYIAQDENPNP